MELSEIRKAAARLKENYRGWWEFVFYDRDKFRHSTQREYDEFRKGGLMKFAAAIREELSTINDWVTNLDGEKPKPMTRVLLNEVVESIKEVEQIDGHPFTVGYVREVVDWSGIVTLSKEITMKLNLYEYKEVAALTPPPTKEPQRHFNSSQSREKLTRVFQALKNSGYFDDNARLDMWLYVCGVADLNGEFKPLNWIKDNGLLAHLIDSFFSGENNRWSIASRCFKVKGKTPNTNTLKRLDCAGYSNNNKRHRALELLLGGIIRG